MFLEGKYTLIFDLFTKLRWDYWQHRGRLSKQHFFMHCLLNGKGEFKTFANMQKTPESLEFRWRLVFDEIYLELWRKARIALNRKVWRWGHQTVGNKHLTM